MKLICTTSNPALTNFNNTVICSEKWPIYKKTRNSDLKLYFFLITLSVSSIFYSSVYSSFVVEIFRKKRIKISFWIYIFSCTDVIEILINFMLSDYIDTATCIRSIFSCFR